MRPISSNSNRPPIFNNNYNYNVPPNLNNNPNNLNPTISPNTNTYVYPNSTNNPNANINKIPPTQYPIPQNNNLISPPRMNQGLDASRNTIQDKLTKSPGKILYKKYKAFFTTILVISYVKKLKKSLKKRKFRENLVK